MKTQFFSALALTATLATAAIAPAANAAEAKAVTNIQATRLEFLNNQTKTVDKIAEAGEDYLDVHTKAVDDVQTTRLDFLDNQTKAGVPAATRWVR